jgi:ribosomal protein S18 acetylase RimI-like enzyme
MNALVVRRVRGDEWQPLKDVRLRALLDSPGSFGSTYEREVAFDDAIWMERSAKGEASVSQATWVAHEGTEFRLDGQLGGKSADESVREFCGMVTVIETTGAEANLELVGMWVDPTHRGTGLASKLVRTAIDHARTIGCGQLRLWVAEPNVRAQRLYLRHGFTLTGEVDVLPSNPTIQELQMAVTFSATEIPQV